MILILTLHSSTLPSSQWIEKFETRPRERERERERGIQQNKTVTLTWLTGTPKQQINQDNPLVFPDIYPPVSLKISGNLALGPGTHF